LLYSELPEIFRELNSGFPLNRIELRNSIQSPLADWIRNHSSEKGSPLESMWKHVFKPPKLTRMEDLAQLCVVSMWLVNKYNGPVPAGTNSGDANANNSDNYYHIGTGYTKMSSPDNPSDCPYIKSEFDRVLDILLMVQQIFDNQKQYPKNCGKISLYMFNITTLLCEYLYDNGKEVPISKSHIITRELYNWYAKMKSDSHALKGKEEMEWIKNNPNKPLNDLPEKTFEYFFAYSSYPNAHANRERLKKELIKWVNETSLPIQNKITKAVA
jgi:hypothetical protein